MFFSKQLERFIGKIWSKGPFRWEGRKKEEAKGKGAVKRSREEWIRGLCRGKRDERFCESFIPSNLVSRFELRRSGGWKKVKEYFGEMSGYQKSGDHLSEAKLEAEILGKI